MSQQQYVWMLALIVAWRQQERLRGDDGAPGSLDIQQITAVAGRVFVDSGNAANDLAVRVLVLMWSWWWLSAKSNANLIIFRSGPLEFVANRLGLVFYRGSPETRALSGLPGLSRAFPPFSGRAKTIASQH